LGGARLNARESVDLTKDAYFCLCADAHSWQPIRCGQAGFAQASQHGVDEPGRQHPTHLRSGESSDEGCCLCGLVFTRRNCRPCLTTQQTCPQNCLGHLTNPWVYVKGCSLDIIPAENKSGIVILAVGGLAGAYAVPHKELRGRCCQFRTSHHHRVLFLRTARRW
jgi:hypothetical protein